MPKVAEFIREIVTAITGLSQAVTDLAREQSNAADALAEVAREQRITNLIVRSQISVDADEKWRLALEAARRMDTP